MIAPCYNEERSIDAFYAELARALAGIADVTAHLIFIDDGSTDGTLEKLRTIGASDGRVEILSLSRNFGHQAALSAGLDAASGDAIVMLDSDLQHPPSLIPAMVAEWRSGFDVVSAVRASTADAGWGKRASARAFYWLINRLSDTAIVPGAADFVLLSRPAHHALLSMPERHRFLRGMVSWIGFKRAFVEYCANARSAGGSKYTWTRMFGLALDAVFSFSTLPIRLASRIGALIACAGVLYLAYVVWGYKFRTDFVAGWASLISVVLIIGGTQLVFIGLIGEYLARTYEESKHRPLYLVRERWPAEAAAVEQ
ncbi:MAG TPA: glycosyltransferase family 2 protein [Vicinamibacterales bacterium]|nr:glycosyltransferase family 2 protein [Vicinamibacterales bacterium]